ncbi:hypothetical protein KEM56_000804, partial [Ascosphaera pollenicola]
DAETWRCPPCLRSNAQPDPGTPHTTRNQLEIAQSSSPTPAPTSPTSPPPAEEEQDEEETSPPPQSQPHLQSANPKEASTTTTTNGSNGSGNNSSSNNITRSLLPAHYSSQNPHSHSIFNTLIINGDSIDGSRALRKRKAPDENQSPLDNSSHSFSQGRAQGQTQHHDAASARKRKAYASAPGGGYDGAGAMSPPRASQLQVGHAGNDEDDDGTGNADGKEALGSIPQLLKLKTAKATAAAAAAARRKREAKKAGTAAAHAAPASHAQEKKSGRPERKSERRLQAAQREQQQKKSRCTVLKKTKTNYILCLRLNKPKLKHAIRVSSRPTCLLLGAIVASRTEGLVQNTMFGLSQNYTKGAKRLIGSIVPASVTPSGQMVRSVGDSKLDLYMPMDDQVDFNNVNRDTLQHVFNALKYTMPKGKTTISEQTVKDFKTLLNAAPASTAATSVPL